MKSLCHLATFLSLLHLSVCTYAQGTFLWDESVDGPFSSSFESPTSLGSLPAGTVSIRGMTEIEPTGPSWSVHPDYFSFTIPEGFVLSGARLEIDKQNVWTWIGEPSYLNELAFAANPSTGELFPQWGISSVSSGPYGMYLSNHDLQPVPSIANYRLDFFVQAVPEPGTISLGLLGLGLLVFRFRKRGNSAR